jgi:DNA-binding NtrC family response regulator
VNGRTDRLFMIVDDEPDMCWALENILRKMGLDAKIALRGDQALKLLEQYDFSMVFLDVKLPDIDGVELAQRIKDVSPSVDIVLISGYFYKDDETVQKAVENGLICDFIAKPFMHDDIRTLLGSSGCTRTNSCGTGEALP